MDEFIAGLYPSMFEAGRPVKEAPDRRSPLVDTGAIETDCKEEFRTRYGGDANLDFGSHPALRARPCRANTYPVLPHSPVSIRVGMTTLLKFRAFGWELDPFRMYFLPRAR